MIIPDKIYRSDFKPLTVPKSAAVNSDFNKSYSTTNSLIDNVRDQDSRITGITNQGGRRGAKHRLLLDSIGSVSPNVTCRYSMLELYKPSDPDDRIFLVDGLYLGNFSTVGAGGREPSVVPAVSTWYSVWVIAKAAGAAPALYFWNASSNPATLPADYIYVRRVGWLLSDFAAATSFCPWIHSHDSEWFYAAGPATLSQNYYINSIPIAPGSMTQGVSLPSNTRMMSVYGELLAVQAAVMGNSLDISLCDFMGPTSGFYHTSHQIPFAPAPLTIMPGRFSGLCGVTASQIRIIQTLGGAWSGALALFTAGWHDAA